MTLFSKIVATNLLLIALLAAVLVVTQFVLSKNLIHEVLLAESNATLDGIAGELAAYHQQGGDIASLRTQQAVWLSMVVSYLPKPFTNALKEGSASPDAAIPLFDNLQPKQEIATSFMSLMFLRRLSLLDKDQNHILGPSPQPTNTLKKPVKLNNQVIAYLVLEKPEVINDPTTEHILRRGRLMIFWASVCGVLFAVVFSLLISRHITGPLAELTRAAKKLQKRDFKLDIKVNSNDELQHLAESFTLVANELDLYDQLQKRWLMDSAHELRTPLTILKGETEALYDGVIPCTKEALKSIKEEIAYFETLVNDLHELSVSESPQFYRKSKNGELNHLVEETLIKYKVRLQRLSLDVKLNLEKHELFIFADQNRIAQVLFNLLENCCRYCESNDSIEISISHSRAGAVVRVEDSGPGVEAEHLPYLFQRLYRTDFSRNRQQGGSGLGLAICKNIVEAHQGKIIAEKSQLGGLAVVITLPLESQISYA